MKVSNHILSCLILFLFQSFSLKADTFISVQSGDWTQSSTWDQNTAPNATDDIIIVAGHTVTINGAAYTHQGNITIRDGGKLVADTGDSNEGFVFAGNEFHVFGELELPYPAKDLWIEGQALFWGHTTAIIFISDDLMIKDESETIFDGICVEVDDDLHIVGKKVSLCGDGSVSIGNSFAHNKVFYSKGAKASQICFGTHIYRGTGADCMTIVATGTGTKLPAAAEDFTETDINVFQSVYVLANDVNEDLGETLKLWKAGSDGLNGQTDNGGVVTINDNSTPIDFTDDFINYTPPADFIGTDFFEYIITDSEGGYASAIVEIAVKALLPVTLVDFKLESFACAVQLSWITSSEENNDYFEIERSSDGQHFSSLGTLPGKGTTNDLQYYQFKDPDPARMNYYRLRQVNYDETFTYSEIVSYENPCLEDDYERGIVSLYPNPVKSSDVFLKINGSNSPDTQLLVTDIMGNVLYRQALTTEPGIVDVRLDVAAYPAGTYFVHFDKKTKRFIKVTD